MKIAVSAAGPALDDLVDPRFGRCACFLIIDTGTLELEVIENSSKNLSGGAGIEAAQRVAGQGVTHVLTGSCGPNAENVLSAAGIRIVDACAGTVQEAVERFRSHPVSSAQHAPISDAAAPAPPSPAPSRQSIADRPGSSAGRGSGRGMGQGGGRGMGGGGGRGMGRRCGMNCSAGSTRRLPPTAAAFEDDKIALERQAESLQKQLKRVQTRIRDFDRGKGGRQEK